LLLGDGIHNLRSALDHLVYACSGPYPPKRCEFPIMRNRDRYFLPERDESGASTRSAGLGTTWYGHSSRRRSRGRTHSG
jgi:hypothetical protein